MKAAISAGCCSYLSSENEEAVRRLKIRDQPIQEDETEAQQAMNNMANQLRLVSQVGSNYKFFD